MNDETKTVCNSMNLTVGDKELKLEVNVFGAKLVDGEIQFVDIGTHRVEFPESQEEAQQIKKSGHRMGTKKIVKNRLARGRKMERTEPTQSKETTER